MKKTKFFTFLLVAGLFLYTPEPNGVPVVEMYTIQPGDTLYDLCTKYRAKDCNNPYLMEYMDDVRKLNPTLQSTNNQLIPGDKLKFVYYVQEG